MKQVVSPYSNAGNTSSASRGASLVWRVQLRSRLRHGTERAVELATGFVVVMALMMLTSVAAFAQRTITGKVTSAVNKKPVGGVTVTIKGTPRGAVTKLDGTYSVAAPEGTVRLVFNYIGFKKTELEAAGNEVNVELAEDTFLLNEVVVTGVSEGTATKKLGFSIGKVSESSLKEVPGVDAANAIRGKISGVQIVQPTGIPGTAPSIRLRGSTNIQGSSEPLIIIDGVIAAPGTSLADINLNDVKSIEVIKGAAGASFYGSQAANGVVQIITKRGANAEGDTEIKFRSEAGFSNLQRFFPLSNNHSWRLNTDGSFVIANGNRVPEADQFFDNPYPSNRNMQGELFTQGFFMNNYVSVASTQRNTNFLVSLDQLRQDGIVKGLQGYERLNARVNVDHKITESLKISTSLLYTNSVGIEQNATTAGGAPGFANGLERGQGGPFYGILLLEPSDSIYARNPDGSNFRAFPTPGRNNQSPLYFLQQNQLTLARNRFLGNLQLSWNVADWWRVEAQASYDRSNVAFNGFTVKNTYNQNGLYTGGGMNVANNVLDGLVASATSSFNQQFGDLKAGLVLKYQYEQYRTNQNLTFGSVFTVDGVPQVQNLDRTTVQNITNSSDVRAENIFAELNLDFKDRYILNALVRRDGSSLFGADQRYQYFYRAALAYRLNEDLPIDGIQEFKLRASIGTSGQRPLFADQYETFSIVNGVAVKNFLGNRNLRPSRVQEIEAGVNIAFLDMFNFEFTYAQTAARDQILIVPLSAAAGFQQQAQNAGTMNTSVFEAQLGAVLINNENLRWDMNLTGSRVRQIVTELGIPPFATNGNRGLAVGGGVASAMFEIRNGEPYGVMYGNVHARSLSQLTTDANGFVNNLVGATGLRPADFSLNSDGYVIRTNQANGMPNEGSINERPFILLDPTTNQPLRTRIGDSNPDFVLGLTNNFSFGNFSVFFNMDAQIGGNVYNSTRQLLYFNERAADLDQAGKADNRKKASSYYIGGLYNGNNPVAHFVEDGGFLTIRELSVSYTFDRSIWEGMGWTFLRDLKLSVSGRNLYTFSNYSGYNPEVAFANNSTSFRVDQFSYPVFRVFSAALQVRF
jgi:TonB-linked SusC/RagA family outer membrane protein